MQHNNPRLTKNNFDLLRLIFAETVCLVHAYELSGFAQLKWIVSGLSSLVVVKAFFVVSGFLIFMSFERSRSLTSYFSKRIRRIYPAYFTVIMLSAIGLVVVSSKNISDYFSLEWLRYIAANLTFLNFLQLTLPGVFEFNNLAAVNGALWTLKIEVIFYIAVPFFVFLFRKFSYFSGLVLVYCLSVVYAHLLVGIAESIDSWILVKLSYQFPGQLAYFMSGAFLYYFLPVFESRIRLFLFFAAVVLGINMLYPLPCFMPFALAIVVVFFGLFFYVGNFGKYGDFSYGVYILHYPVIQLLLLRARWWQENPWYFLFAVLGITIMGAFVLWHLVEKRFLFRGSHYIATISSSDMTRNQSL